MNAAFIALVELGLIGILTAVWLLVAGERRRMAASFLVAGIVLLLGAGVVFVVSNHNYEKCVEEDWTIRLGQVGSSDACDGELVLDGVLK